MTHEAAIQLIDALRSIGSRVRLKVRGASPVDWDRPLFSPSRGYLETAKSGPVSLGAIECIDIERKEQQHRGRLVAPLLIDHTRAIEESLAKLGLEFQRQDTFFRIANEKA